MDWFGLRLSHRKWARLVNPTIIRNWVPAENILGGQKRWDITVMPTVGGDLDLKCRGEVI